METAISIEKIIISDLEQSAVKVNIYGHLDEENVDGIAKGFYSFLEGAPAGTLFLFDLFGLTFINSKGVGYLLDFYRKISENSGKMILSRASENVLDILEIVGVTKIIDVCFTIDEAKLALITEKS